MTDNTLAVNLGTHFRAGDLVESIHGETWGGELTFTIKSFGGSYMEPWATIVGAPGTALLKNLRLATRQDMSIPTPAVGVLWTPAKDDELDDVVIQISELEKRKKALIVEQRSGGVAKQKAFLTDLAAVLVKHSVAVCAKTLDTGKFAEVYYQFMKIDVDNDLYEYHNGRSHSTGSEYTCRLEEIE